MNRHRFLPALLLLASAGGAFAQSAPPAAAVVPPASAALAPLPKTFDMIEPKMLIPLSWEGPIVKNVSHVPTRGP